METYFKRVLLNRDGEVTQRHVLLGYVLFVEVPAKYTAVGEHAEDVFEGEVGFLDVHGDEGWDDDVVVAEVAHLAAAGAGEAEGEACVGRGCTIAASGSLMMEGL
jgi:hypothetical protein